MRELADVPARIDESWGVARPIFVVGCPRSGSSLLLQTLARSPDVATIGGESHILLETIAGLHPREQGWTSNALTAADATLEITTEVCRRYAASLRDRGGNPPTRPMVWVEKTPKNSLRVPFLTTIFPDARFVYLYRYPAPTLASMIEAWRSGGFRTYPRLPDWTGLPWSLLLTPGWQELRSRPLPEVVARQWATTTDVLLDDLAPLATAGRVTRLRYEDLLQAPQDTMTELTRALGLSWDVTLGTTLPLSPTVVTPPRPDKWRRQAAEIEPVLPLVRAAETRAEAFLSIA